MTSRSLSIEPFTIHIDEQLLEDLTARLRKTRWPEPSPAAPWDQGTDLDFLRSLCAYWADEFDWRAQERELNRWPNFHAEIDGLRVHFVHQPAISGAGIPLILTHGWPSAFVELLPLAPLLTDPSTYGIEGPGLDIVLPSLPGYAFSQRPAHTGVTYRFVARLWHQLMQGLGYERYGAGGGDFGAGIATFMAFEDVRALIGLRLTNLELSPYKAPGP